MNVCVVSLQVTLVAVIVAGAHSTDPAGLYRLSRSVCGIGFIAASTHPAKCTLVGTKAQE